MTNVTQRTKTVKFHEVAIPAPAYARDLSDLLLFANRRYKEIHGVDPEHDDAYTIEANEDEIVAVIKETVY